MPVASTAKFHQRMFVDFCREEIASGGPDPHLRIAEEIAVHSEDPLWVAGVYTAPYVVSTACVVAKRFSRRKAVDNPASLSSWVGRNWDYLPIRKERRVNGTGPAKLAEILTRYGEWLDGGGIDRLGGLEFHDAFAALDPPHYGRYFRTKLYEVLRRTLQAVRCPTQLPEMTDIVPKGGAHPRKAFTFLGYEGHAYKSDRPSDLAEANEIAAELKQMLSENGVDVGWFVLEVLLCNYRQAVAGGQYPGRAHDSELGHCRVVQCRFEDASQVLTLREGLFPHEFLGERAGWDGRRTELGRTIMSYGYVWSDRLYDYRRTTDLAQPVEN